VIDSEALYCNNIDESIAIVREIHSRLVPGGAFWSRTFAPGTWGVDEGNAESIGEDYWITAEGPMAGKGACRLLRRETIPRLYGDMWDSISVGEITRYYGNPQEMVREWIIVARKRPST
jgi:hypothetical protein